jgi:hypothetical protein
MYTAHAEEMPELASRLSVTGSDHIFLSFGKHAFTGDGARVNTFGPRGLSGGALLDLGELPHRSHMPGARKETLCSAEW